MFDAVSGQDGSGIVYVCELAPDNPEIPNTIRLGDTVELFINGEGIFAIVTDYFGDSVEGVVTEIPRNSPSTGLEIAQVIRFGLTNISRCFQAT
ncbi:hypothetical protein BTA51_03680 [Hahella sp. CCB-MM4]|uniref:hypothetical protein n=1 Tax=Hahella sp. (strain CCB-MM4) TaxID=1926491 RepID=UPI000B9BE9C5|nr:hypothetical protein [Hahella sp. CCB-MM4]OZG74134.1 hypothetical protein BTA51_03680 [Hahella sp. CCB-MM4]